MKRLSTWCCALLLMIICGVWQGLQGKEIENKKYGFRLWVPDAFQELPLPKDDTKTVYQYADHEPDPQNPPLLVQVQQLKGHIDKRQRLKLSDMAEFKKFSPTLEEFQWKGLTLDVMRMTMPTPLGEFEVFTLQYPLAGVAVQLQVGGLMTRDAEVRKLFQETAAKFENLQPLDSGEPHLVIREMSQRESIVSMLEGLSRMAVVAIGVVVGVGALIRHLRKPKQAAQPLFPRRRCVPPMTATGKRDPDSSRCE